MATRRKTRTRRTAAQKAATRKLVAFNRSRRRKTAAPARRRRRNPVQRVASAPVRRRRNPIRRRRRNPIAARIVRRRRNPVRRGMLNAVMNQTFSALTAAAGGVALDILWAKTPLPAELRKGYLEPLAKGFGAIAMAWIAGKVINKSTANQLGAGALTTVAYKAMLDFVDKQAPDLLKTSNTVGLYVSGGAPNMGLYVSGNTPGLGYYNPAVPVGTSSMSAESNYYAQY